MGQLGIGAVGVGAVGRLVAVNIRTTGAIGVLAGAGVIRVEAVIGVVAMGAVGRGAVSVERRVLLGLVLERWALGLLALDPSLSVSEQWVLVDEEMGGSLLELFVLEMLELFVLEQWVVSMLELWVSGSPYGIVALVLLGYSHFGSCIFVVSLFELWSQYVLEQWKHWR